MKTFLTFTETDLRSTLENGELPDSIRNAGPHVVVIWTQDWCPQWADLQSWVLEETNHAPVYLLVYNLHPWFHELMHFKEKVWGNRQIPYVRHYYQGILGSEHNWLPRQTFREQLKRLAETKA